MMNIRNLSIKRKLIVITMVTSAVALLLASAGFLAYDLLAFRQQLSEDLQIQAEVVGSNSMAALAFQDSKEAAEILSALQARKSVVAAAIYTPEGVLFAEYRRAGTSQTQIPATPSSAGSRFEDNRLTVHHPIALQGQHLGTLYIDSDMSQWNERVTRYTGIVAVLMLGSALFALLLSSRLQRMISEPILGLEQTMRSVTNQKSFSLRAVKTHSDEIGSLIDGFNSMLAEIQQRDAALQGANLDMVLRAQELEQEAAERLRAQEALKVLNSTLERRVEERSAAAEERARELARSEAALHQQTRILQSILDSMSDGVIVADDEGRLMLSNPAAEAMLEIERRDTSSRDWIREHHLYLPDMVTPYPIAQFPLTRAIAGDAVSGAEVFVRHAPGRDAMWLSVNATPLKDDEGVLHNGVAVFHDITARKRAEEELLNAKNAAEAANRAKSQFLANMSHELRTPLNAIIGYSEMLAEQAVEREEAETVADLHKIHSAGKHLQSLIDDILDLSKIEAGKMELFVETFDLPSLVQDVVHTIRPLVEKNGNVVRVSCADEVACVRSDMTKLRQVLFNLLSNAGKFTSHGTIDLTVSRDGAEGRDMVRFRVADSGIGMTDEQMERLFQEFTQVDASTTRKYGGTGLGLAISRRFCRMLGGDITVDSVLGEGATFTFEIPAKIADAQEPEPVTAAVVAAASRVATATTPVRGATVLVIDDDPIVHDLMVRLLGKEGLHVVCAATGEEGLRLAATVRPVAITLDVMMPDIDGWTVLARLKANEEVAAIPVVLVTMTDDRNRGYALGAAEYLTKPLDPSRLLMALKRHRRDDPAGSVLVVDDDPMSREPMRRYLESEGWSVREARNGREALIRLTEETPTVIVLDLLMPEVDGMDLLIELQRDAVLRDVPVVVVTAKDVTGEERRRLDGAVRRVLRKGAFEREELLQAVRQQVTSCLVPVELAS